jgi:hypothetical protein
VDRSIDAILAAFSQGPFIFNLGPFLILMDTYQVVKAPSGLTVVRAGQALAADLGPPPPPPPPPVVAPVGKGKAPIGKGKGKAPPPLVVTKG